MFAHRTRSIPYQGFHETAHANFSGVPFPLMHYSQQQAEQCERSSCGLGDACHVHHVSGPREFLLIRATTKERCTNHSHPAINRDALCILFHQIERAIRKQPFKKLSRGNVIKVGPRPNGTTRSPSDNYRITADIDIPSIKEEFGCCARRAATASVVARRWSDQTGRQPRCTLGGRAQGLRQWQCCH